jgi:hypothetical protein
MRFPLCIVLTAIVGAGCASEKKKTPDPLTLSTPLPLDPTETYEIAEWWTNGKQLLQLSEMGVYRLHDGINRYRTPIERGRWSRRNYAALWIEPYAELPREPTRISIRRVGDRLELDMRSLQPMTALETPPDVIEDHLIGGWSGDVGSLVLGSDLRYSFSRSTTRSSGPAELASEEGGWKVQDDFLVLRPDSRGIATTVVRVLVNEDGMFLDTQDGRLVPTPLSFEGS